MLWQQVLANTALLTVALSLSTSPVVHEKRSVSLPGKRRRVHSDAIIPVRIGLRQNNLHTGYDRLMEVSHPGSMTYGKHLSKEEVHSLFAPADETIKIVKNWLLGFNLIQKRDIIHYENKGWLAVDMPAKHAETLFGTEYYEHETNKGELRIGCDQYHLPRHISSHVDFVKPGVKLSAPLKKREIEKRGSPRSSPGGIPHLSNTNPPHYRGLEPPFGAGGLPLALQNCGVNITPTCIKALYGIPTARYHQPENSMGLFETYDAFSQEDVSLFLGKFAGNVPSHTAPQVISVDGGKAPVKPGNHRNGRESDIDLDLAISLIYPQSVMVYQVDDLPIASGKEQTIGFINTFLDSIDGSYCDYTAFGITGDSPGVDGSYPDTHQGGFNSSRECGTYELTRVLSISYGGPEIDLPKPYVERQCNEIMKLGLQGHTILSSSGDFGVAAFPGADSDKKGCLGGVSSSGPVYNPDYPSGCPYITSVGATRLYPNQTIKDPESAMQVDIAAWNRVTGDGPTGSPLRLFATGGGFSNYFPRPDYQAQDVANYLTKDLPFQSLPYYEITADTPRIGQNGGVYNRFGRGYPDVSANGAFLLAFLNLTERSFFGTSLASPIFGSVITLINEERSVIGKGPVGFINPALYKSKKFPWNTFEMVVLTRIDPSVLNDITNGSNPNCGSQGFQASKGWDPVTGLGTPNYPEMLTYFSNLP
ncbi:Aorsin [Lachnellula hyalina]|uniref:Aorsin n=1 Tax=Lachnellula hyalina TaxID=1316788 RepID=A0A8H8TXN4_9HELO|nr:Aorsin [Lachnellula hyalina]TVY24505.1 Aorsin [Lachnellula hyalina]